MRTLDPPEVDRVASPRQEAQANPPRSDARWPIGVIVATYWIAHRDGPAPDGLDTFEAERLGLIDIRRKAVTTLGEEALRAHGWL